eukprot:gene31834-38492_t
MKFFQKRWLSGSLSHVDYKTGKPQMVDVSSKVASCRTAEARAQVLLPKDLVKTVFDGKSASLPLDISTKKGPVFATAVIAGVQAAKNTSNLIPFCHNIVLDSCAARSLLKAGAMQMKMQVPKSIAALAPAFVAAPVFASDAMTSMPVSLEAMTSMPVSLEVTFAAYLAVLLGTFVPVTFLIVLYSQSEARKAGAKGQQ